MVTSLEKYKNHLKENLDEEFDNPSPIFKDKCDLCNTITLINWHGICKKCFNKLKSE